MDGVGLGVSPSGEEEREGKRASGNLLILDEVIGSPPVVASAEDLDFIPEGRGDGQGVEIAEG